MNDETKIRLKITILNSAISIGLIVLGFLIGRHAVSQSKDIPPTVTTVTATTTVSISQEELDCKKQGGEFEILPVNNSHQVVLDTWPVAASAFELVCQAPATNIRTLSSKTISVGN